MPEGLKPRVFRNLTARVKPCRSPFVESKSHRYSHTSVIPFLDGSLFRVPKTTNRSGQCFENEGLSFWKAYLDWGCFGIAAEAVHRKPCVTSLLSMK
jgi:hypothetical protein